MRQYLLTCESIDDDDDIRRIIERLGELPHRVMLRIPIQWNGRRMDDPRDYKDAFQAISEHADLMIEFVDSDAAKHLTPNAYKRHVENCLEVLGQYCKVGEAGNEVNANNWTNRPHRHPPEEVVQMVQSALDSCAQAHLPAAITYYLSTDEEPPMLEWIRRYASELESQYALISYYPNSARTAFTADQLLQIFTEFSAGVHAPIIGWGEYGTEGDYRNVPKDGREIVRVVEQDYWQRFSGIPKYAGLGGYWDWGTQEYIDEILKEVWR